jgi:predicted nucleic acid-binding protein
MKFLLDSNTLIAAKNGPYHFDVCPGFWDWVLKKSGEGVVLSVTGVGEELRGGSDELAVWAATPARDLFESTENAQTVKSLVAVNTWVMQQNYKEANRAAFFAKADPLLVAHAHAHGYTVVTLESKVDAQSRKVKIPNVCEAFRVPWITPWALLRQQGARFVLYP